MENKKQKTSIFQLSKKEKIWMSGLGLILVLVPILFFQFAAQPSASGDAIGGTTAPFLSFFGSVLVYMALKAQINANTIITDQFSLQQQKENIQNFENSFFNLINFHLNIVNSIEKTYIRSEVSPISKIYNSDNKTEFIAKGKQVFEIEYEQFSDLIEESYYQKKRYLKEFEPGYFEANETRYSYFRKAYTAHYRDEIDNQFGNYFRNLYRLIKIIDQYDFKIKDPEQDHQKRYFYTSIVRAQFSDYELKWLFLNGLSEFGAKFKPLLEKYALLKNINKHDDDLKNYFKYYENKKVFGE
jgi:hypothetical protein